MAFKILSAAEAALYINHDDNIGVSGFTAAGAPKLVTKALAERAEKFHAEGKPFKVGLFSGASTSEFVDGVLSRADAIKFRAPYQSHPDSRNAINQNEIEYSDIHLSHVAQNLRWGFLGKINIAIIEATEVTEEGEITLTTGIGISPTLSMIADKIIIELNSYFPKSIKGLHDLYQPSKLSLCKELPVFNTRDRVGDSVLKVDPSKIIGIVENNSPNGIKPFTPPDEVTHKIAENVANFLVKEYNSKNFPQSRLHLQSGVGNIANAVLGSICRNNDIPPIEMYTEVIQDSVIQLIKSGRCKFASGSSLTISDEVADEVFSNFDFFRDKIVLRPSEMSNHPEIIRRMGLVTINTALEADIYGNVNSSHVMGSKMMNGIGGSSDFTRNAYISIFTCKSIVKDGKISSIVPMVTHCDHSEHSVKVLITEQGVADLRGKSPKQRAETIIENCVHPSYRPMFRKYLASCKGGHTPHNLRKAFAMHIAFEDFGDMREAEF